MKDNPISLLVDTGHTQANINESVCKLIKDLQEKTVELEERIESLQNQIYSLKNPGWQDDD